MTPGQLSIAPARLTASCITPCYNLSGYRGTSQDGELLRRVFVYRGARVQRRATLPSRESAAAHDQNYLLHDLEVTPVRFRLNPRAALPATGQDAAIAAFVRDHPGATMNDLRTYVPGFGEGPYEPARAVLTRLVAAGVLILDGQVPLEELDLRYERVSCCDVCGEGSATHA